MTTARCGNVCVVVPVRAAAAPLPCVCQAALPNVSQFPSPPEKSSANKGSSAGPVPTVTVQFAKSYVSVSPPSDAVNVFEFRSCVSQGVSNSLNDA